jgi:DNA primase
VVQSVKDRVSIQDLFEVLGVRVKGHTASCPLHQDKTPSMGFNKQLWYCFVCGVGGDVITLVEKTQDLPFKDALNWLNDKFSLGLTNEKPKRNYYLEALNENYQILKDTLLDEFNSNCERYYPIQWALYRNTLLLTADDFTFAETYHQQQNFIESQLRELENARYKLRRTATQNN